MYISAAPSFTQRDIQYSVISPNLPFGYQIFETLVVYLRRKQVSSSVNAPELFKMYPVRISAETPLIFGDFLLLLSLQKIVP
jgi:hypothetical protein